MRVYLPEPESFSRWALDRLVRERSLASVPADASVLLVRVGTRVDRRMLDAMPELRVVASATTGLDHIDDDECRKRGVQVLSLKGDTAFLSDLPNTAEHAFALLLALYRRLPAALADVFAGRWRQAPFRGSTLGGKCFGIVGYGRLGRIAGRIATGFGMDVLAYDPQPRCSPEPPVQCVGSLEELAARVDVLSLHADLNASNRAMIDARVFGHMRPGSVLLNTARGQLVDESALLEALETGTIAGAALDVICDESVFDEGNRLVAYARRNENLLLTPHIGGQTEEAVVAADKHILSKLENWCATNAC